MPRNEALKVYRDGREECLKTAAGNREYKARLELMAIWQEWKCAICTRIMNPPTFDHQDGRGHGGGHRDDRIKIDGQRHNAALCNGCNHKKGSQRYHWVDGEYVPALREYVKLEAA